MALHEYIKNAIHKLSAEHEKKTGKNSKTFHNKEGKKEKHVGFKKAENHVEREGYSKQIAGAIIASAARHASPAAKKANPHLARVKG
jgi:hypothetical protein